MSSLRRQKQEAATSTQSSSDLQRQLSEMKDRNTALEQQLMEYAGTITDQSKVVCTVHVYICMHVHVPCMYMYCVHVAS